jgi:transcription elongation GreA/GreB family factor
LRPAGCELQIEVKTEYLPLENELAFINGRSQQLEHMLKYAQLIEPCNADNIVDTSETVVIPGDGDELERASFESGECAA